MKPRYSVIIPAKNEELRISETLRAYAKTFADSEIIVVLNGCTDLTAELVRTIRVEFDNIEYVEIDHAVGKGGAVRAGFLVARSEIVGFVDADGSTSPGELRRLFEALGSADVVVGSRWIPGAKIHKAQPLKRRVASRVFNALVRSFFRLRLRDTQCGAKVFRAHALQRVLRYVETSNMAFDVDLLYMLHRSGATIKEVPTEWVDVAGTRVQLVSTSSKMLAALIRLRLQHGVFLRYIVPVFDRLFPTKPIRVHDGFSILVLNWRDPTHPQAGGAETYLFEMAKRWVIWGNRVQWLTAGYPGCKPQDVIDGVEVTRVGNSVTVYAKVPWTYLSRFRNRFDIVVDAENGIPFFSPLFSLKPKLCLIFHVHKRVFQTQLPRAIGWLFVWLETRVMPYLYRNSDFITISNTTRSEMLENNFSRRAIEVVHSGVDANCAPGVKSNAPLISYVGRLKRYKRIDALIRAFAEVRRSIPDAHLVIAGAGDQENDLRELTRSLKIQDAVEITGFVDDAKKIEILQRSWVFVTPSSMEGWGIAAIEANACGAPAIAYDVPGLREAIVDGVSGLLVPDGDDLAGPIIRVLTDDALRGELSRGAIARAANFSWSATAERFLDAIIRSVAGDSFGLVRTGDHWSLVQGAGLSGAARRDHVPLQLRQVETV